MFIDDGILGPGDCDPRVYAVQRRLLSPSISGVYDAELEVRVRGFQKVHGLLETGLCDPVTLKMLLDGSSR